jgi:cytochrome c oxidase cbb3-type subunit 2
MNPLKNHEFLEKNSIILLIAIIVTVLIGGIIEIIPLFRQETVIEPVQGVRPYTPLELAGYNIYIREGCYNCHSQQIRPLRDEVTRYGHYSLAAESMYDHPFQWGSKRTGPDLARVGGKYSDEWHVAHMMDPRSVVPESIMPKYSALMKRGAKLHDLKYHLKALKAVGVPYSEEMIKNAADDAAQQATGEARTDISGLQSRYGDNVNARDFDGQPHMISEMDALIAYLQVLGTMVDFESAKEVDPGALQEIRYQNPPQDKYVDETDVTEEK